MVVKTKTIKYLCQVNRRIIERFKTSGKMVITLNLESYIALCPPYGHFVILS